MSGNCNTQVNIRSSSSVLAVQNGLCDNSILQTLWIANIVTTRISNNRR